MNDNKLFKFELQSLASDMVYNAGAFPPIYGIGDVYSLEATIKTQIINDLNVNLFNGNNYQVNTMMNNLLNDYTIITPFNFHIQQFMLGYLNQRLPEMMSIIVKEINEFNTLSPDKQLSVIKNNPQFFKLLYQPDELVKNQYLFSNVL